MCNWSQNWRLLADTCICCDCLSSWFDGWEPSSSGDGSHAVKRETGSFPLSMKIIYALFLWTEVLLQIVIKLTSKHLFRNWDKGNVNFRGRVFEREETLKLHPLALVISGVYLGIESCEMLFEGTSCNDRFFWATHSMLPAAISPDIEVSLDVQR